MYVLFEDTHTGCHQMSSDLKNAYYHIFQRCVKAKVHDFSAQNDLKISAEVKSKLTMTHFSHLNSKFGM